MKSTNGLEKLTTVKISSVKSVSLFSAFDSG